MPDKVPERLFDMFTIWLLSLKKNFSHGVGFPETRLPVRTNDVRTQMVKQYRVVNAVVTLG